jgi:hypothetical protein
MKAVITSLLVSTVAVFYAQCPSAESISKDKTKTKEKNPYSINSQSRSGSITGDKEYEMSFIAQPGMDYRLTTKAANPAAGTITYEVYEMVVEKKVENGKEEFKRVKHVLASSSNTGGQPLEFTTDKTRKIFVAVNLSGGDTKKPQCVGVLIEDKRSTKLGF